MRNLIVNADDLGWTEGVNRGIVEAHRNGIVSSASLLANGAAFAPAVELARATPGLAIGVHLNLSDGPPAAPSEKVPNLVNNRSVMSATPEALLLKLAGRRNALLQEVTCEWNAQIHRVREAGIEPTHLDGHKHVHMLPGLFEVAVRLAKKHNIGAIRISHESSSLRAALSSGAKRPRSIVFKQGVQARGLKLLVPDARDQAERAGLATADYLCGIAQTGELTREGLERLLKILPNGTTELMVHPGYADEELAKSSTRLQACRQEELQLLTNTYIRNLVASQGIRLVDYAFIAQEA